MAERTSLCRAITGGTVVTGVTRAVSMGVAIAGDVARIDAERR